MNFIAGLVFFFFVCLIADIPYACARDGCPLMIAQIKADSGFASLPGNIYLLRHPLRLLCEYHENGKLQREIPFLEDKVDGTFKTYHENGNLQEKTLLRAGKREGIARFYHENGKRWKETPYRAGKIEGIHQFYDENGSLYGETPYKNNLRNGVQKIYRPDGRLIITVTYRQDLSLSGKCHHRDGTTTPLSAAEVNRSEEGLPVECD